MVWTILIIKKSDNGWYINYIEQKIIKQISINNLQNFVDVIVFDPKIKFSSKYVSVIDNYVEITDSFIFDIYNIMSNSNADCIGLKGLNYIDGNSCTFSNISDGSSLLLPITTLNPIKLDIIVSKLQNIHYYINSENLSNIIQSIDNIKTSVVFMQDTTNKLPFSIIITAYQTQNYIEDCLDSIENQTYFKENDNYEILVGVDACQETFDKLNEIKHKYRNLNIYMMNDNKGTYITTNTLIGLTKYENIIRFDSDDIMTPNLVKELVKDKGSSDIVILGYFDFENGIVGTDLALAGIIYFKKSVMDIAGGYQPWRCAADTELISRLANKVKISQLKKAVFYRRIHENSLTRRDDTKHDSELRNYYTSLIKRQYSDNEIKIERVVNGYILNDIKINDYFDHVYCLNLDRRIEKWLIIKKNFNRLNIDVQRFSAVDGDKLCDDDIKTHNKLSRGAIGCMLSYYEIIKHAKLKKYKNILIFEDDVIFDNNFNTNFTKIKNIKEWKMLHLGASQYGWDNITHIKDFYYSNYTQGTFSIAFDMSIYDEILNTAKITNIPIDAKLTDIQKKYYGYCYTFYPNLTIADVSYSDIRGKRDIVTHSKNMKWDLNLYNMNDNVIKILLCVDVYGWAFDNIANAIIKYNPFSFISYTKIFFRGGDDYIKNKFNYDDWDYVFVFFEGDKLVKVNKNKLISGCYSAIWLESKILTKSYILNRFKNCRAVIFVNEDIKNEILYTENDQNAIDFSIINDSADETIFYRDYNIKKNDEFTVLFVGNINREIKRFSTIKQICEKANVKLNVATNISHNELYKEYNKAHLCINFSVSEGGPQTFFESALCETPMIINSDISMSKKIPCFSSNTEDGMIKIIKYLKDNPYECIKMGLDAKKTVLEYYTYENASHKFANFFLNLARKDRLFNPDVTVFVIRAGENPNYNDCIESLNRQTMLCKIDIIKDYAPSSLAFQEMINRCTTRYYIQVDEDMILYPSAIEKMYYAISKSSDVMVAHALYDVHLDFNIIGVKIFDHNIYKKYPYDLNPNSDKIPTIEQLERILKDGYTSTVLPSWDNINVIGLHSPKWTTELIFERYFDLMEKYKVYGYTWMKDIPNKLEYIYNNDPSDINYFAMMGAKTSISSKEIRKKQKNFRIKDENYLKIKNNYDKKIN